MILETRHLMLVAAVAQHGTLTRAGRELHLTQSALSHQLTLLESRLATPLFHRLGKRMMLTESGSRLLLSAQRTLAELREAEEDLRARAAGRVACLRVSTECYTTYHWMPRIMRAFADRHPGVDVQIVAEATNDPLAALHDGRIDLAVMMNRFTGKHIRAFPLFEDELVLVTSRHHPLASRPFIDVGDLSDEHLLTYASLDEGSSFVGTLLREAGVTPQRTSRIMLTEAIAELAAAGIGVSVLARWAMAPYAARGQVALVPITRGGIHRRWHGVALRESAKSPHIKEFLALLAPGPSLLKRDAPASHLRRAPHWKRPASA